ncbi:hypothetical protein P5G61_09845 [Paenibacillus sp. F6_3S_P_1C]|uniref:Calcineurin-like phosphoesterase domain-containing protein n=1 Tax=Paenibacillus vandeheii TaxID=3035917 RepID=A0ABT8J8X2_9BACL|nr:hypothetical protein [Paenibacillus vandeheii]MDN4601526.1 hypothetical protein [Paenibacillus vandeheii]
MQDKGVETIIVLAHDPASTKEGVTTGEAADLAKALPADSPVDVIVAGDNHALANGEVNGKLFVLSLVKAVTPYRSIIKCTIWVPFFTVRVIRRTVP